LNLLREGHGMIVFLVAAASVALGFAIGCIPVVQEHLHLNIWIIVPVSGLILGMGFGWLQFQGCLILGKRVTTKIAICLAVVSVVAYLATEVGTYATLKVQISGVETLPDGKYKISSLFSFSDYMSNRLGATTIKSLRGQATVEIGGKVKKVSFAVDLLGAVLGALGTLLVLIAQHPFCAPCNVYKKRHHLYNIRPEPDETTLRGVINSIGEVCKKQSHGELVRLLRMLESTHQDKTSHIHISADSRYCPDCREATILGKVLRLEGNAWKEISDLAFSATHQIRARVLK
jgi:hypothetical protein